MVNVATCNLDYIQPVGHCSDSNQILLNEKDQ